MQHNTQPHQQHDQAMEGTHRERATQRRMSSK
jgi:hypothetical protein